MQQTFQIQSQFAPHYSSSISNIIANLLAAKKYRASVYHVTGDIHYITLALPRKKTILTVHDTVFMENSRGVKRTILKWLYLKLPVRSCLYVTAISEATKKDIVQYTGCSPDKVIVIPD